jgi:hypothetical protein
MSAETEAAGLADEFPGWEAWRGVDRLWHARVRGAVPAVMVHGEDPDDLRDQIIRYERLASYEREKQAIERARGDPPAEHPPDRPGSP